MMLGDQVIIDEDFDGSIVIAGFPDKDVEDWIFEIVSFEEFQACHPKTAKAIKAEPPRANVYLKKVEHIQGKEFEPDNNVFVLYPSTAIAIIEPASPVCRCPISRLWNGIGHYTGCAEA